MFTARRGEPLGPPGGMQEMQKLARELASQGKLRRGAPLAPEAEGALVRVRDGRALVTDGPFAESKEVLGGFWVVDVASREEAIEIARRSPHARWGTVEVSAVRFRIVGPDLEKGTPYLLAFRNEPGLTDPEGSKMERMIAFGERLKKEGKLLETAPLAYDEPGARVEVRGGKALVTDGPFVEAKEVVGGYSFVRVASRAEAIELAKHYPAASWGPVEVREILFFDPV